MSLDVQWGQFIQSEAEGMELGGGAQLIRLPAPAEISVLTESNTNAANCDSNLGPATTSGTPISNVRTSLKNALIAKGHHARFSEELIDPDLGLSILAQQVTHAEAFDIVFSLPDSPGSIAELHDFARIPSISPKIVAFIDNRWNSGYSNKALTQLESTATCRLKPYDNTLLPNCILEPAFDLVARLQEFYYMNGRRF